MGERTLRYHVQGPADGPVLILLGGGPGFSSWNLQPVQARAAASGRRVVLMDMLGVGENEGPVDGDLLDAWIRQVETVRRALGHSPVELAGHSWGALMALLYTRAHPERVARLLLLNPVDPGLASMRHITTEIAERRGDVPGWDDPAAWDNTNREGTDAEGQARRQIERVLPAYFHDRAIGRQFSPDDFDVELNIRGWQAYERRPVRPAEIRGWGLPIHFLSCRQDLFMPEQLDAMRGEIDFASVQLLDDCGHFPWVEAPRAFGRALDAMLDRS